MKQNKSKVSTREIVLLTLMLAFAGSASVFIFFINSEEVQRESAGFEWEAQINEKLDQIVLKISNSLEVSEPFLGTSTECRFRSFSRDRIPYQATDGFIFTERGLIFAGSSDVFRGMSNPIISGCRNGEFRRYSSNRLGMRLKAYEPEKSGSPKEFYRVIYLKNQ